VVLSHPSPLAGTKPFRFFNYLTRHPSYHQLVLETWSQAGSLAMNLTKLSWKQKSVKGVCYAYASFFSSMVWPTNLLHTAICCHHSAKVSWEVVTRSKEAGGLGIKDLGTWNRA
ncbi:hypothetical protein HID58_024859, partial [Brassica napus]